MKKIIAIIGGVASGKDTAADYIAKKLNIPSFQISQSIKDIAKEKGIEPTRENLISLGTELARKHGLDYHGRVIFQKIKSAGIITGIRMVEIIEYLKENSQLILIAVEADPEIRFNRAKERGKLGEAKTLEEFIQNENDENSGNNVQRLFDCMKMATYHILNEGSVQELYKRIDAIDALDLK